MNANEMDMRPLIQDRIELLDRHIEELIKYIVRVDRLCGLPQSRVSVAYWNIELEGLKGTLHNYGRQKQELTELYDNSEKYYSEKSLELEEFDNRVNRLKEQK